MGLGDMTDPSDQIDALLACPFCGGTADFTTRPNQTTLWGAMCNDCTAYRVGKTKAEAIAAWNTRAPSAELAAAHRATGNIEPFAWTEGVGWHAPAHRAVMASVKLGAWMSAAMDDDKVCDAMKADIREWFSAGEPMEILGQALAAAHRENAKLREALANMVYETTHLSPMKPNGDHDCTISAVCLHEARAALGGQHD